MTLEMTGTHGPLDENCLRALEQIWEFQLPKEYRIFLLKYNGGRPNLTFFNYKNTDDDGSVIDCFFGIYKDDNNNLLKNIMGVGDRYPSNSFPIADDVFGNRICIIVKGPDRGKIYFWDHETEADTDQGEVADYSNMTLIADSFNEFIDGLYEDNE
jgi:hypothetical protein